MKYERRRRNYNTENGPLENVIALYIYCVVLLVNTTEIKFNFNTLNIYDKRKKYSGIVTYSMVE